MGANEDQLQFAPSPSPDASIPRSQRVGFRVHSQLPVLLLPPGVPAQLESKPVLTPVPSVKPWLRGILNLRGTFVPVFDLALSCDLEAFEGTPAVLVLSPGPRAVGVLCIEAPRLLQAGPAEPVEPSNWLASLGTVQYRTESGMAHEFDLAGWLRGIGRCVIETVA